MDIFVVSEEERAAFSKMLPEDVAAEYPVLLCAAEEGEKERVVCGVLAASLIDNSWNIDYIAVNKENRRKGLGAALVGSLLNMARGALADEVSLEYNLAPQEESPADSFFDEMGFALVQRSNVYTIPLGRIGIGLKNAMKDRPKGRFVILRELQMRLWEQLRQDLIAAGEAYNPPADLPARERAIFLDPGNRSRYDDEVSSLFLTRDGKVGGCMLVSEHKKGISVDYLCALSNDVESKKAIFGLFYTSFQKALAKYGKDCLIYVNTQNTMSERIFLKLAEGGEEIYGTAVEREMAL